MEISVSSVGKISLFAGLSSSDVLKLTAMAREVLFDKGETVIKEGESGDSLFIIEKGEVVASKDIGDGRQEVLSVLGPSEFFGEMALIDKSPRSVSVIASEPTILMEISSADLEKFLEEDPKSAARIYGNFAKSVAMRLRGVGERLKTAAKEGAKVKTAVDNMTSEIISVLSHELGTPVAVIRGSAELLDEVSLNPSQQREFLEKIKKQSFRLAGLLDDIVHLTDAQYHEIQKQKINVCGLNSLLSEVTESLKSKALARGVEFKIDCAEGLLFMNLNENKIRKALFHLFDNGIKFNREGGTLKISVLSEDLGSTKFVRIHIEDEGAGIEKEKQDCMFNCFYQVSGSMDPQRVSGMGLGLPLAKNIIQAHGGSLKYERADGGGSRFVVTLPATA